MEGPSDRREAIQPGMVAALLRRGNPGPLVPCHSHPPAARLDPAGQYGVAHARMSLSRPLLALLLLLCGFAAPGRAQGVAAPPRPAASLTSADIDRLTSLLQDEGRRANPSHAGGAGGGAAGPGGHRRRGFGAAARHHGGRGGRGGGDAARARPPGNRARRCRPLRYPGTHHRGIRHTGTRHTGTRHTGTRHTGTHRCRTCRHGAGDICTGTGAGRRRAACRRPGRPPRLLRRRPPIR